VIGGRKVISPCPMTILKTVISLTTSGQSVEGRICNKSSDSFYFTIETRRAQRVIHIFPLSGDIDRERENLKLSLKMAGR
jgi:hypothetical protein